MEGVATWGLCCCNRKITAYNPLEDSQKKQKKYQIMTLFLTRRKQSPISDYRRLKWD